MKSVVIAINAKRQMTFIARSELIAKGIVYLLLGNFVMLSSLIPE
jgi:hypothetical protein